VTLAWSSSIPAATVLTLAEICSAAAALVADWADSV